MNKNILKMDDVIVLDNLTTYQEKRDYLKNGSFCKDSALDLADMMDTINYPYEYEFTSYTAIVRFGMNQAKFQKEPCDHEDDLNCERRW